MNARGLAWPGLQHLLFAASRAATFTLLFVVAYGGTDWIAGRLPWRVSVQLPFELGIPLVPVAVWAYMSLYFLLALVPFVLRARAELDEYLADMHWMLALACLAFLLLPARTAYAPIEVTGTSGALLDFADRLNLDHNLVPSLHVAFAVLSARVAAPRLRSGQAVLLRVWALAIAAATVLTHQHHLLDVASGYALARWTPDLRRRVRSARASP